MIDSFIGGGMDSRSQSTLLINGGYIPGIRRQDNSKLMSNFLFIALATLYSEYKSIMSNKKIIISLGKPEEYEQYKHYFRQKLIEYRKLQSIWRVITRMIKVRNRRRNKG